MSDTKWKGALGAAKAIAAFAALRIPAFQAVAVEHLPYDMIVAFADSFQKVQVKYREAGAAGTVTVPDATSWSNSQGAHRRPYRRADFDVLALYIPDVDRVLFLPFTMVGKTVSLRRHQSAGYYWWEDFLEYPPRSPAKHPPVLSRRALHLAARSATGAVGPSECALPSSPTGRPSKIRWPAPEELARLVDSMPVSALALQLGVSDNAVRKHCRSWGVPLKPRGHWARAPLAPAAPAMPEVASRATNNDCRAAPGRVA